MKHEYITIKDTDSIGGYAERSILKIASRQKAAKGIRVLFCIAALVSFMSMPTLGQWFQPDASPSHPQQLFAQYQSWLQNADMQLQLQTANLPPVMQLQMSIYVIQGELLQWGAFLQQYYPAAYASRCAVLQQRRQVLMLMMGGGGGQSPMPMPLPDVHSGGRSAKRCNCFNGMCRHCYGTGYTQGFGQRTLCGACNGTRRCSLCNEVEIRRLD